MLRCSRFGPNLDGADDSRSTSPARAQYAPKERRPSALTGNHDDEPHALPSCERANRPELTSRASRTPEFVKVHSQGVDALHLERSQHGAIEGAFPRGNDLDRPKFRKGRRTLSRSRLGSQCRGSARHAPSDRCQNCRRESNSPAWSAEPSLPGPGLWARYRLGATRSRFAGRRPAGCGQRRGGVFAVRRVRGCGSHHGTSPIG